MSAPLLHFGLLGEAAVFTGNGAKVRVSSQKGMALLAYLAMNPGPNSRPSLADLLWGDRVDRQARQSLRQCMVGLRRDLGETTRVLTGDDHTLRLDHALIAIDVRELERAAAAPCHADRLRCLQMSSGLFLEGFHVGAEAFDQWVEAERNRLAAIATRTFIQLAEHAEAEGDAANALLALERLVATDPGEEEWHRRLIRAVAKHQGPDAAIGRAKWLASQLRRHVDAEPSAETRELLEAFRRDAAAARTREIQPVMTAAAAPESASELPPVQEPGAVEASLPPVATSQPGTPWRRFQPRRYAAGAAGVVVGLLVAAGLGAVLVGHGSAPDPVVQAPEQASPPQPQKEAWYGPRAAGSGRPPEQ
jgi:DNA-binding SARP family transcriptional activator